MERGSLLCHILYLILCLVCFYPTLLGNLPARARLPQVLSAEHQQLAGGAGARLPRALSAGRQQPAGGAGSGKKPCRN